MPSPLHDLCACVFVIVSENMGGLYLKINQIALPCSLCSSLGNIPLCVSVQITETDLSVPQKQLCINAIFSTCIIYIIIYYIKIYI